ncbi:hypothetical protein [Actinomadura rudentiformis]|uniref:Uncharacterized protein n=1 Tax=Actinomadura rudentiformis TaxID=359158 RepID=A0A6H9YJB3_9ACTN|nr:hypothetical protein [Actinomadura rudentiformis]KAB2341020.1 hypothetical protein F8566_42735 [Actinomadura rudentiformis]
MSYRRHLLVARDDRPLPELYALRPYRRSVVGNRTRDDNWQVCSLDSGAGLGDSVSLLVEVAAETHTAALLASFTEGGCAAVEGFSRPYGYWQSVLGTGHAAACPALESPVFSAEEAAAGAAKWAEAASRPVPPEALLEVLQAPVAPSADAVFEELLNRLGLTGVTDTSLAEIG